MSRRVNPISIFTPPPPPPDKYKVAKLTSRRALFALLAIGLLVAGVAGFFVPGAVALAQSNPHNNYDADGDGLIEISNLDQLNAVRWDLNGNGAPSIGDDGSYASAFPVSDGGSVCPAGTTCIGYELTANLNFDENGDSEITSADSAYWNNGAGWQPIGDRDSSFTGTFDGNGKAITNLFIKRESSKWVGLFGILDGAGQIRNLGLINADVAGDTYVGRMVGENQGTIIGSYATGSVSGVEVAGGLVGWNNGTLESSYAAGFAEVSVERVGGLVGRNNGTITFCHAKGTVISANKYAGGLVGFDRGGVAFSYSGGYVEGIYDIGGLIGETFATVYASYSTATVRGENHVGGLVGEIEHYRYSNAPPVGSKIIASYATGAVYGTEDVGGLIGYSEYDTSNTVIIASYSTGPVFGRLPKDPQSHRQSIKYLGGLIGRNHGAIKASYYDNMTSERRNAIALNFNGGARAAGKTTSELQAPTGYTGLYAEWNVDLDNADGDNNFATGGDDPWDFGTTSQYPVLKTDFNGDGTATWQEFGNQLRQVPFLTATLPEDGSDEQIELRWTAPPIPYWADTSRVGYTLQRNGEKVEDYVGGSFEFSDADFTPGETYFYQVAVIVDGAKIRYGNFVKLSVADSMPKFENRLSETLVLKQNSHFERQLPKATGGDGALTYAFDIPLPDGLTFDATTRTISGTPTAAQSVTYYYYTVTDEDNDSSSLTYIIEVIADLMPTFSEENAPALKFHQNRPVLYRLPQATAGNGSLIYSISPSRLPDGLVWVGAATLHGMPTVSYPVTEYTLTATDEDDDWASLKFTIEVIPESPAQTCANGITVANPDKNQDLVQDCVTLLTARDILAGTATLNWGADLPIAQWVGVEVSDGRVKSLKLKNNRLSGSIPAELGQLAELKVLSLDRNRLTGGIPAELAQLTQLTALSAHSNGLTGSIPAELGQLSQLTVLRLSGNRLSGGIPAELGQLSELRSLMLDINGLSGSIPAELGQLTHLTVLLLDINQLGGSIPEELGQLTELSMVRIGYNEFSGCIPAELEGVRSNDFASLELSYCGAPK